MESARAPCHDKAFHYILNDYLYVIGAGASVCAWMDRWSTDDTRKRAASAHKIHSVALVLSFRIKGKSKH